MSRKLLPLIIGLLLGGIAAAQVPISGLPPVTTPLSGTEQLPVVQGGTTKKATVGNITASAPALNATYLLRSSSVLLPNSRTLAGTAAEILLTDGGAGSALTLSTPQPIATTSTPTFAGLTLGTPLTVPNGGTGALTLSGVLKGNGVSAFSSAASSDVISLWSGCAVGTPLLSFSGSCVSAGVPAGSNTQVQYNNSSAFGASSLFTFNSGSVVLNLGASTTPGTFSVGTLDTMIINGVQVPIPSFAANSNIQGVIENHSYVNGVTSGGSRYYGVRSEGTIASPLIVANGDHLSTFLAAGYNGTTYSLGGQIQFLVDGTPGATAMPTDLDFAVSAAGSQTPTSRLTLKTDGSYSVSGSVGSAGNFLRSAGAGAATGWSNITIPNTTTFGDVWYGSASNVMTPLAGNTTTSKLFFTQTGTGIISAGPVWTAILASDLPGSFSGFANPTASLGLTAVNGAATTAMRSDAAPALSQAIAPTWTAQHIFTKTFTTSGTSGDYAIFEKAAAPAFSLDATGAAADAKVWEWTVTNTDLLARTSNDAGSTTKNWLDVTRSANVLTGIALGNTTDKPAITLNGPVTVPAPTSGDTVTSTAVSTNNALRLNGSTGNGVFEELVDGRTGTHNWLMSVGSSAAGAGNFALQDDSGLTPFQIARATGAVVITPAAATVGLTITTSALGGDGIHVDGTSAAAGGVINILHNTVATGYVDLRLYNDQNTGVRSLQLLYSGSTFSGAVVAGGPSGEQGLIGTAGSFPLTLATNSTDRLSISSTGAITMPSLASSSAATTGVVCWTTGTGNLTVNTAGTLCTVSARRFKKNISPLDVGLAEVMRLKPVSYDLKSDPTHLGRQVGLIAEEVGAVDPRLRADAPDGQALGVRYMQLTAVLVKAIQEQQHEIDALRKELHRKRH